MKTSFLPNVRFTSHAVQRCREFRIKVKTAKWQLYRSTPEPIKFIKSKYARKYPYYRYGTVLFCVARIKDKYTGEPLDLVITVYDQRMAKGAIIYETKSNKESTSI